MSEEARAKVKGPAIGLMVTAILGILYLIFDIVANVFLASSGGIAELADLPEWVLLIQPVVDLVGLGLYGFLIYCSLQMKNLESHKLAMTGSIIAMVPCSCCCLIGLPIGIWSLIVLNKPEVKAAFGSTTTAEETF